MAENSFTKTLWEKMVRVLQKYGRVKLLPPLFKDISAHNNQQKYQSKLITACF